ncbi:response regulator transcription factor [Enterococcus xiangfangensis]|uniref:response regulator transcription factor n=1 Tax=Enterococcus xiangfangensis TaxID=1296537 RepID=UPI0010F8AD78|nr:response regulator transcription factor [Enterococcus xiangfangensis]MBM7712533.1 DNA-binding response OmpR family regulator [Enterococcus xiangfangensis]NBK08873.1 DNA-binding response regulator [Enterococcus asini]
MTKILLVEDDAEIQMMIKELLTEYEVVSAYSGTEGQLRVQQESFDLILLDLMLPGLNGEELLAWIRQRSALPIIVISAKNDLTEKIALLQAGADDYLVKPFDLYELLARIQIQLRHAAKEPTNQILSYQELSIDLETREVRVNETILHLTAREYAILLLFLQFPKKVFSRSNIYENVWQEPFFESEKTINVHISNLRGKLQQAGAEYIKTVWGVGFKFD